MVPISGQALYKISFADDVVLEENFIVVGIDITSVDIENGITVAIEPSSMLGILQVTAEYNNGLIHEILNDIVTGGTHIVPFNVENLPEGEYTSIIATLTSGDSSIQASYYYYFTVLGIYLHTQYNTPIENECGGTAANACLSDTQCQYTSITLLSDFISEVYENGSGESAEYGSLQWGNYCWTTGYPLTSPCGTSNTFAQVNNIIGSCGSSVQAGQTVAVHPNHPVLQCGDIIYIHTIQCH